MSDLFDIRDDDGNCLSQLELDRLLADEDADGALEQRLDSCPHCQQRLATLTAERDQYLQDNPPHLHTSLVAAAAGLSAPARTSLWQRIRDWRVVAPLSAALGAAIALLMVLRGGGVDDGRDVVRLKGGEQFSVLAQNSDGSFRRVGAADRLAAGTVLGFQVLCTEQCNLSIVGIGETGAAYVVDRDRSLPPEQAHNPDFTVELDNSPGAERFYAAFCAEAADADALTKQLERSYPAGDDGRRDVETERDVGPSKCSLETRIVVRSE